jgi:hypothetical protein
MMLQQFGYSCDQPQTVQQQQQQLQSSYDLKACSSFFKRAVLLLIVVVLLEVHQQQLGSTRSLDSATRIWPGIRRLWQIHRIEWKTLVVLLGQLLLQT